MILEGAQPKTLTRKQLFEMELPIVWQQQEELLGLVG